MFDGILIDKYGRPYAAKVEQEITPLWPDPFIEWLEPRLRKDMTVFEWGSGNGTLWLARRVKSTYSVEHHVLWNRALRPILPCTSMYTYIPIDKLDLYPAVIKSQGEFDIIIVDGMCRDACIHEAVKHLAQDGLLVLDNSDSEAFEAQRWLETEGWKSVTLRGKYRWTDDVPHDTRVFWRD